MKYYIDITLLPDAEANLGFLWHKVYQQVHIALVENAFLSNEIIKEKERKEERVKKSNIAISFPKFDDSEFPLGSVLRLFSETQEQLNKLNVKQCLNRLEDYTHCKPIQTVDENKIEKHIYFSRKQFKSSARMAKDIERRAKYQANKTGVSVGKIKAKLLQNVEEKCKLPFIHVISLSSNPDASLQNKDRFKLFIEKHEVSTEAKGDFTCYGLSSREKDKQATVPWF